MKGGDEAMKYEDVRIIHFYIPKDLHQRFSELAVARQMSKQEALIEALERWCDEYVEEGQEPGLAGRVRRNL